MRSLAGITTQARINADTVTDKQMNTIYDQLSDRNRPFLNERLQHVDRFAYRAKN